VQTTVLIKYAGLTGTITNKPMHLTSVWGTSNDQFVASETLGLNEPLTRMVLNPDVTVRSRGVIEKCSFCVQRLQGAKLEAKKQNRPLQDGEATTACQTACATRMQYIFGDRNDQKQR
jgi:hypothetical protein